MCLPEIFLSTPSARRATGGFQSSFHRPSISIHALREEGDSCAKRVPVPGKKFLSTPSARRATNGVQGGKLGVLISIHALREEGDALTALGYDRSRIISIHALREEGDHWEGVVHSRPADFYPRPPRGGRRRKSARSAPLQNFYPRPPRGGRLLIGSSQFQNIYFYPRPPRGGRHVFITLEEAATFISIHALREEGDCCRWHGRTFHSDFYPRPPRGGRPSRHAEQHRQIRFLSTPSARRATRAAPTLRLWREISIHALREEGDLLPGCAERKI